MKVLLVDDERRFASVLTKRLRLRGVDVAYACSGEDALEAARAERFDVALLDIKMPRIGGIELRRRLAEISPGMRFVFMTGHGSMDDYEVGSAVASAYLAKPVEIEELVETLEALGPELPGPEEGEDGSSAR
jgi:DNA-binding response OmpR family regulator